MTYQTLQSIFQPTLPTAITANPSSPQQWTNTETAHPPPAEIPKRAVFLQYRRKCSEDYACSLHRCQAPCNIIFTLRKLKTILPSLKPPVEKKSWVIYHIECAVSQAAYVGQTGRHLMTRLKEHNMPSAPQSCRASCDLDATTILATTSRGEAHCLTQEALFIEEMNPQMNTKAEFWSRTLTIKFF